MMRKHILIVLFALLVASSVAYGDKAAFVVSHFNGSEQRYSDILEDMGFTVDIIGNNDLPSTDFSEYDLSLINNDAFGNWEYLPINDHPCLIFNKYYMDDFDWVEAMGTTFGSGFLNAFINDPTHFITDGFPLWISVHNESDLHYNYIPSWRRGAGVEVIASTYYDSSNAVVAAVEVGAELRNGQYTDAKGVFFGIEEAKYWTPESEQLFRNSVTWLVTDFYSPVISDISVEAISTSSARIVWTTNMLANSSVFYGPGLSSVVEDSALVTDHSITLNGLQEATTYDYEIVSCNDGGYCRDESGTFETLDITAPSLISYSIEGITDSEATINLDISEEAMVTLYYGSVSLDNIIETTSYNSIWQLNLVNLDDFTQYFLKVEMCDDSDNCANSSIFDFTTEDYTDPLAPSNLLLEVLDENDIRASWDLDTDVDVYNIYISDTPDGFDYGTIYDAIHGTEYIDSDAANHGQRYYVVRAQDAYGNEEGNENVVGKFDLDLSRGYNLVSLSLTPFNSDIGAVMHQDAIYNPVSEVMAYNGNGYDTVFFDEGLEQWSADLDLNLLEGYFFRADLDNEFTIVGYPIQSMDVNLVAGMNLVGMRLYSDDTISDVLDQTPADYSADEISGYDNGYIVATYYPSEDSWFSTDIFDVEAGKAYWVKANEDFILEVSA